MFGNSDRRKIELHYNDFVPDLMLPAWFVTDPCMKVVKGNESFRGLVQAVGIENATHSGRWTAEYYDAPDLNCFPSIWRHLIDEDSQHLIEGLLDVARDHRKIINNFRNSRQSADPSENLAELVNQLRRVKSGETSLTSYAFMPDDAPDSAILLRAGVRIAPPGGIRTRVPTDIDDQAFSPYQYVVIVSAWRILINRESTGRLLPEWRGMQPAIHDALEQKQAYDRETESARSRVWLQNASGVNHGIGEGLDDIGRALRAGVSLMKIIAKREDLTSSIEAAISTEPMLGKLIHYATVGANQSGPKVTKLARAFEIANEFNEEHLEYCRFMAHLGDSLQVDALNLTKKPAKELVLTTLSDLQTVANGMVKRILNLRARRRLVSPSLMQHPVEVSLLRDSEPWLPLRIHDRAPFGFTLFQLFDNASKYSSLRIPMRLQLGLYTGADGPTLCVSVSNDLNLDLREESTERNWPDQCESTFHRANNPSDSERASVRDNAKNKHYCQSCLRMEFRRELADCFEYAVGRGGGKGLFMVKYLVETCWCGKMISGERMLDEWFGDPRNLVRFGYVMPMNRATWEYL